jgi:3-hydroxybutyryl-CoA dehydrogenase
MQERPETTVVIEQVEADAPDDAAVASNTSAIPIRELRQDFRRPERFLGLRWFFPARWVPGVEDIAGPHTTPEIVERCHALIRRLSKRPVTAGDSARFVANRIQFAMVKEAAAVVADGVATPEQVDLDREHPA